MITYAREDGLTAADYIACVGATSLGQGRPLANTDRIQAMLDNADLVVTARDADGSLLGLFRAVTDWHWVCYCIDLAVVEGHQGKHIGQTLLDTAAALLGPKVSIVLLSKPNAEGFYRHIGMVEPMAAFMRPRTDRS
ncbi:GNAT family N-acetyltransferase [Devosia aquimaris]|uniref:GNAT family N-acetyltransferase n=1 Tax=Devosia aquimaris TaxID=2866214 RepID=UPI001CD13AD1|nr:GNAT family N-acetyltransferase [Devosia sp. CJK-A8-3]